MFSECTFFWEASDAVVDFHFETFLTMFWIFFSPDLSYVALSPQNVLYFQIIATLEPFINPHFRSWLYKYGSHHLGCVEWSHERGDALEDPSEYMKVMIC